MLTSPLRVMAVAALAMLPAAAAAQARREFRYPVPAGASVSVINEFGPISVSPSASNQLIISATPHSSKVEIDENKNANRIEIRTHILKAAARDEARVDYVVQVPPNITLTVRSNDGPIRVERASGDLTCEGESAQVQVVDGTGGHVHVRTVNGPVTLTGVKNTHVEVTSVGGNVTLKGVTGPKVSVNTGSGSIRYEGDFGSGGEYTMSNHTGDIDVVMPATASIDISARSVTGTVQDDFQFKPESHPLFPNTSGKSFAGTANQGGASVSLRSFSGRIRVKKQ